MARYAGAAAQGQQQFSKREPIISLVLSWVFPGLGQIYNGPTEQQKGFIMMGVGAAGFGMMIAGAGGTSCQVKSTATTFESSCGTSALLPVGLLVYLGDVIYSMYDGYTRAGDLNREHGITFHAVPDGRGGVRASVNYRIALGQ